MLGSLPSDRILVEHMSRLFDAADEDGNGVLHRDEFVKVTHKQE